MKLVLAAAVIALATGCSGSASTDAKGSDASGVDWSQFAPGVKDRIDKAAKRGNCDGLQREFDSAKDAGLLTYIDAKMKAADCY